MDIFQIISTLCPAAIPTFLIGKEGKNNIIWVYLINVMIVNLLNLIIFSFVSSYTYIYFTPLFTVKYIGLGIVNSFLVYIIFRFLKKSGSLELIIEQTKSEKKNEKKNK